MWTTLPLSPAIVRLVTQGTPVRLVCSPLVKCDKELHNYSQRIEAYGTLLLLRKAIFRVHYYCFKKQMFLYL